MNDGNTIWLELRMRERVWLFGMEEGGQPLGVGSGWCTDVRIDDARVALVQFELARAEHEIWLRPRGPESVRLNTARAREPRRLTRRSMIEFLEYELELVLHTQQPRRETRISPVCVSGVVR
jgi:hypothetical protein